MDEMRNIKSKSLDNVRKELILSEREKLFHVRSKCKLFPTKNQTEIYFLKTECLCLPKIYMLKS